MPSSTTSAPLTFDAFWRWLADHRNCLVRVGAGELVLMDHDALHWDFFDEDDGRAVVQSILGKSLVGEVVIDRSEVLFVQASPDLENPTSGYWNFECIGGSANENYPLFFFVLTHGMEGAQGHQVLKH
jgi:hypothetical protein